MPCLRSQTDYRQTQYWHPESGLIFLVFLFRAVTSKPQLPSVLVPTEYWSVVSSTWQTDPFDSFEIDVNVFEGFDACMVKSSVSLKLTMAKIAAGYASLSVYLESCQKKQSDTNVSNDHRKCYKVDKS